MRRTAFLLAVLAGWIVLALWAARVELGSPFVPAERRAFGGYDFAPVFGKGVADAGRLRATEPGEDYMSLQSLHPTGIDAATFTTLRYRFADFPRTLELSLVFRTIEHPDDVAVSLPWPGNATGTFDLSQIPEWRGRIVEVAFAEFPVAQIVPPAQGFKPFELVDAQLWSRSWRGDLAALATDWLSAWPWTQRSVHALGRDTDTPRARSIVVCAALACGIVLVAAALAFGWRTPRFAAAATIAAGVAWLALDLIWQNGLWDRLQTTRAVYAGLSWQERQHTVADAEIASAAETVRAMLRGEPQQTRILVYAGGGSGYELLRFIWHLLPRQAAPFGAAVPFSDALPEGCLIVFYDSDVWRTEPAWRLLLAHSNHLSSYASIHGDGFDDAPVAVFRFHHARR